MSEKPNILIICGKNKKRSKTGEQIFRNDSRINVRSAGVSPKSEKKIGEKDITWADLILVMEHEQREKIKEVFSNLKIPKIIVLEIPDDYEYLDNELIEILTNKINMYLKELFNI